MSLVTISNLTKSFGKEKAVNNVSFEIKKGSCIALLGPNGAGKTTTLRMLAGIIKPTSGSIQFTGMEKGDHRQHIGYLPQHPVFYNWMTAEEFLLYVGQLAHLSKKEAKAKTDELLELVGLVDAKKKRIRGFSGGMKQRLGIAQTMIHNPRLIMLDEPVSALDPVGRREVIEMMRELKKQTTILFSTHVLHDAEEVCDDIVIIRKGEVALEGTLPELRRNHQQPLLTVSAEENIQDWLTSIKEYDWVSSMNSDGHTATIFVTNVEEARMKLIQDISSKNIPITSFSVGRSSLEDLFMKVVKS
ncbi:ABC transporter ATP-binding protein [Bacillus luteolus]|uniref:ABC transporter ATP-binding protein n=1 Tax=Litchfieldia luteola TaxID=682179 RepID=A0ABR9QFM8_9BACI|nr:ABC transporter ATP-binding protein [Cytobacillus luteolus]MBE4907294.1 ABC transporter ATP-binding protein [Cytobacillus luteolus]MBP1943225.1 ABC-2 type transport system ATP-binding protein [Cytobacillus luteolus]